MAIMATASVTIADISDGLDGTGISSTKIEYQAGSSGTSAPTGIWSTSVPSTSASAPYLWTRVTYNYSDGRNPEYVYSVGSTPEGIEIGGRNLLPKAKYGDNIKNISNNSVSGYGYIFSEQSTSPNPIWSSELNLQPGVSYTLSFIAWIDVSDSDAIQALCVDLIPDTLPQKNYSWTNGVTNVPTKFVWTFKSTHSDMLSCRLRFFCDISSPDGYKFKYVPLYITDIKLEEGNKATDWTPAPEDTEEKITELNTKYTEVKQTADGLSTTVASHTTQIQSVENQVTTNLLKPTLATTTYNGITCTNNGDGTYTLNGKATANASFALLNNFDFSGKLKIVGCPDGGSISTFRFDYTNNVNKAYSDIGNGAIIEHFSKETYPNARFILFVTSGATLNNIVFKPMITTNLNATYDDFVPYTGSTGSLNGDLANNSKMTEYAETVATQTAEKFSWLVKSGTSSTDFTLTDRVASLLSEKFNIDALTTFKNSAENGTSTVINGGSIKTNTITADKISANAITADKLNVDEIFSKSAVLEKIFAQSITATGTITGGSFVGSSFEGATGSFTGSVTATSGRIGFLDIHSSYMNFSKDDLRGFYMDSSQIIMSNELINASTSIKADGIETTGDVSGAGTSLSYERTNSVRHKKLYIGDVTINSGSPFSMSIASQLENGENLVGACLDKCWPHSTWAFACTLLLNGTDLYIATTTTQVYTVSVVIFYKDS